MGGVVIEMSVRLGVAVSIDSIAVVIARGHELAWCAVTPIGEAGVEQSLEDVLRKVPGARWPRPRLTVVFDYPQCHSKLVRGLPSVTDARSLGRVIAASPQRFFLDVSGGLVTTGVRVEGAGIVTVAAFPREAVASVVEASRRAGYRVARFIPADVALTALTPTEREHSCAAALAAALMPASVPLMYGPVRKPGVRMRQLRRLSIAAGALAVIIGVAVVPALRAEHVSADARRHVAVMARAKATALTTRSELDDAVRMINAVAAFESRRSSRTMLLAQLAGALPTGAAVLTLQADSAGVTVTALAPHAANLVRDIEEIPGVERVAIVGPVTRETAGTIELERITLRFRLVNDPRAARVALATAKDSAEQ